MSKFISKNPATEEVWAEFDELTSDQVESAIQKAQGRFDSWKTTTFEERAKLMKKLAQLFREEKDRLGEVITKEMGKTLSSAIAEAEKCALVCDYYADNAEHMLSKEIFDTEASASYARFDPIGIVFAVMPWNYPMWQVLRFAAPAVMAGNVGLLKHASNVPQCGMEIEKLFLKAGFPEGVFQNLLVSSRNVEAIVKDDRITATTLTGSEYAGSQVAMQSGETLKKAVLELGGSDPFIVLEDADLDYAAQKAALGRLLNTGQTCIAAKRFILVEAIAEQFIEKFVQQFKGFVTGDPMDAKTQMGPLAGESLLADIEKQVAESVSKGAKILIGGNRIGTKGYFYEPTILADVKPGMPAYDEELFGPVASVIVVKDADEAIRVANDTRFGLGASIWTKNTAKAEAMAAKIDSGCVFINSIVKSDPRLPFGGVKKSGFGRELSHYGIKEFVNIKTVWVD